jgi:uncharacterized protein
MVRQRWRQVAFLHWPFEPSALAPLVPAELALDTFDGAAWVSVVAFSTTCEFAALVPVPGPVRFPETNVRTYVRGPDGDRGLLFLSLDVTNRSNAVLGRTLGLPYRVGHMDMSTGKEWRYTGRRTATRPTGPPAAYDIAVTPATDEAGSERDIFLTAVWSAYIVRGPLVLRHDVEHPPWPLRTAAVQRCDESLLAAAGVPRPAEAALAHVAIGVDARLSGPRPRRA